MNRRREGVKDESIPDGEDRRAQPDGTGPRATQARLAHDVPPRRSVTTRLPLPSTPFSDRASNRPVTLFLRTDTAFESLHAAVTDQFEARNRNLGHTLSQFWLNAESIVQDNDDKLALAREDDVPHHWRVDRILIGDIDA